MCNAEHGATCPVAVRYGAVVEFGGLSVQCTSEELTDPFVDPMSVSAPRTPGPSFESRCISGRSSNLSLWPRVQNRIRQFLWSHCRIRTRPVASANDASPQSGMSRRGKWFCRDPISSSSASAKLDFAFEVAHALWHSGPDRGCRADAGVRVGAGAAAGSEAGRSAEGGSRHRRFQRPSRKASTFRRAESGPTMESE